ncbi:hypothetical protein CKO44_00595 [Rubrivivax gelatinosus]|uniref:peptidoglycan editing factor PgeF n=1 Tax=Rubrivivax gelatinosus TaxID=28068 RepID=UPI0019033C17|nr:peptidoglycan editing factor PgeF [Rubrivivax gelatinosus]MBK1611968.1 hypothetical protein [Rubrivivax gelatinosus]
MSAAAPELLRPSWPAPAGVGAAFSTRRGGVSAAPYDSFNLRPPGLRGDALDAPEAVFENQRRFAAALGARPVYLDQVHGAEVVRLRGDEPEHVFARADASVSTAVGVACTVLVADCLPVLLCTADGRGVGAAHAGWRGLAGGVVEACATALCEATGAAPGELLAWLGPCIGPRSFEVGQDVVEAFGADPAAEPAADAPARFRPRLRADGQRRWLADLPALARARLAAFGVLQVSGGSWCTVEDGSRFFSFRRDRITGRMAAAVWRRG